MLPAITPAGFARTAAQQSRPVMVVRAEVTGPNAKTNIHTKRVLNRGSAKRVLPYTRETVPNAYERAARHAPAGVAPMSRASATMPHAVRPESRADQTSMPAAAR